MKFSLFYFANEDPQGSDDKYRLLIEGAKFADQNGFSAVWTPERHFHAFGGLYPNPAVTSAALAVLTEKIQIRAGSVVLPLHNVLRVAEEWSLVDNLSKGRVGIAFASGWHSDDFVFFPGNYVDRKQVMLDGIEAVKRLWRGESIAVRSGSGKDIEVRVFPRPIQPELPIWLTAAGSPETFIKAGEMGANILTHLLGQSVDDVLKKVSVYRDALERSGHGRDSGKVALMLHTFIGENREHAREIVRKPFTNYLRTSIDLIGNLIKSMNLPLKLGEMTETEMGDLLDYAFNRYFETSALFGSPADCEPMIERLKTMGIDEVACLIDFGVDADSALAALPSLAALKDDCNKHQTAADYSLLNQIRTHKPTLLQCTPSMMSMLLLDPDVMDALASLKVLMLGGEALPFALVKRLREKLSCRIVNMYGPTETTIWSATQLVDDGVDRLSIGRPIANTEIHILDQRLRPVPAGIAGELCIGGDGLARGYFNQPGMTADRFIPNPLSAKPGARLYRTGDRASYLNDGRIEFLGRLDQQVKVRGFRIELGEIEAALGQHSGVKEAVAAVREDDQDDKRLVAYIVANPGAAPGANELRDFLRKTLPEYMMPSAFATLNSLPLTPNGKVDRKALPRPESAGNGSIAAPAMPRNKMEQAIAEVWREVLKTDRIGINDNFFDIGGHSLLMAQAHSRLQEVFDKKLPLIKMLEHPTVSSLARYLGEQHDEVPVFEQSRDRALKQRERLRRQSQAFAKRRH
jgi:natural product biosynthesis luciferase-like monooxygenase protein